MNPGFQLDQPPHGFVRYVSHHGTDQDIVDAARVSYGSPSKGEVADRKLLHYLYRNRHTSPFEQCSITFNIKMPIFVMRQFVRHRTFKLNEVSARYTKLPEEFFLPLTLRLQNTTGNKQGSTISSDWEWYIREGSDCLQLIEGVYREAYRVYELLVGRGVANEQARMVLPVGIYTEIRVNADLHNLMHFFRLRRDPHAQGEMQDVAKAMFVIFAELFPWTASAYNRYKVTIEDLQPE